ncbi:transmembrane protein, putative [Bodo saltans]|uniref:Transmembrane protein, putative n=1 Tax=Bodo saltans TaxID=75058 RepID=A0A0S4JST1_BODSA|nr:transmembrane protein, putative [Bodo saltans]|eukprot:CUG93301.1 transmembrane protein, putative [Bodo saltans]
MFVRAMVPSFVPNPTVLPSVFTTSPGYVPQGGQTPLPTLAPGVTLPHISCVLNIEGLYADLVTCVNGALTKIYVNRSVNAIMCMSAAEKMRPCVTNWLDNVMPTCAGADIYLNNVLSSLNASSSFNFCGHANRCSDGAAGAQAVCTVVNAAMQPSGGATFAPQLQLPKPIANLPTFTVPSNTITMPPTTTTMAPVTTLSPQTTAAPGGPTTAAPATTAAPNTPPPSFTTTTTTTNTPATTTTTTTVAPTQQFLFRCELPYNHVAPPSNFALLVGFQIGLNTAAPIEISEVIISSQQQLAHGVGKRTVGNAIDGPTFTFFFVGDSAATYSQELDVMVNSNSAAVAQSLGLQSIAAEPYTPQGSSTQPSGLGAGAVAGIILTILVVLVIVGVVGYRHHQRTTRGGNHRTLRGSMIQEEGGYGGTSSGAVLTSKRELGGLDDESRAAPIHSAM